MTTSGNNETLTVKCPTCQKAVLWNENSPFRPFCSDRCRLIDLGEWASEGHRIPGKPVGINHDENEQ